MGDLVNIPDDKQIESRKKIIDLEASMRHEIEKGNIQEIDCPVKHHFAPGLYAREMFIPAGTTIVGKIHKHAHVNTISKGKAIVFTEFEREVFEAPVTFVSKVGTKRAVYAETDVIWTTYHPTEETDLEKIEKQVIAESYDDLKRLSYEDMKGLIL